MKGKENIVERDLNVDIIIFMINYSVILFYSLVIFILDEKLAFFTQWTQLLFELIFTAVFVFYFSRKRVPQWLARRPSKGDVLFVVLNLILGMVAYSFAKPLGAAVPFDFSSVESYLLLILAGPIIEECVFRHVLFMPMRSVFKGKWPIITITSAIFSYAHLRALFGLQEASLEIKHFVVYQGFYTLVISILWGYLRFSRKSLLLAVLMHIAFNLGFGINGFLHHKNFIQMWR